MMETTCWMGWSWRQQSHMSTERYEMDKNIQMDKSEFRQNVSGVEVFLWLRLECEVYSVMSQSTWYFSQFIKHGAFLLLFHRREERTVSRWRRRTSLLSSMMFWGMTTRTTMATLIMQSLPNHWSKMTLTFFISAAWTETIPSPFLSP